MIQPFSFSRTNRSYYNFLKYGCCIVQVRTYTWQHTPTVQPYAGRALTRHNPLDEYHKQRGGFMGYANGWERPMFYLKDSGMLTFVNQRLVANLYLIYLVYTGQLECPKYDWYGYYGHTKRPVLSQYEKVHEDEYAPFEYSERVQHAIRDEVQHCRSKVALFDQTSFGKVGQKKYVTLSFARES